MRHGKRAESLDEFQKRLGKAIAGRRKDRGFTQDDLAGKVGVDAETISRFERGVSAPSIERVFEIAGALGCGILELLAEASPHASDKGQKLAAVLEGLPARDQRLLLDFAELLARRSEG